MGEAAQNGAPNRVCLVTKALGRSHHHQRWRITIECQIELVGGRPDGNFWILIVYKLRCIPKHVATV